MGNAQGLRDGTQGDRSTTRTGQRRPTMKTKASHIQVFITALFNHENFVGMYI